ncbi:hypothetical protein [Rufibacter hautae]|uniref:Uncharacterized protein n=1 Tax=Rufibacter hautae TaxID=2595005 RepID=A0A5B6TKW4_9BACT|nr:hypothetical protein [Rufibacter hautae]KAA3440120.1 hypothetical protein FOA19_05485 [Rufibacter hautae]
MGNRYTLKPASVLWYLLRIVLVLLIVDTCAIAVEYYLRTYVDASITGSYSFQYYVTGMFGFDGERNIPTYVSTINLLISAILLFTISKHVKNSAQPKHHRKWYLMGCMFAWLSADELFSLHELLVKPSRNFLKESLQQDNLGFLNFAWFVPYVLFFMLVGLYLVKFVLSLPKPTLLRFIGAGTVFIAGAVGMEMVGGDFMADQGSRISLVYKMFTSVEEVLEMVGIILFIYSLLKHMEQQKGLNDLLVISLDKKETAPASSAPKKTVIKEEEALLTVAS